MFVAEWFTGWLFTRHIAESAIRAAWVAKGDDGPAVTERLQRLEKRDMKLLLNADKAIAEEWNVRGWPTLYLIDHKGVIKKKWLGSPRNDLLDHEVEKLVQAASGA